MTKTEPVVVFSGLAAAVGFGLHWLLPDATIPDEAIVAVVFGVAVLARQFVSPSAQLPDAEILEQARRAVQRNRDGGGPSTLCLLLVLLIPAFAAATNAEAECVAAGGRWVSSGRLVSRLHPGGRPGRQRRQGW